MTPPHDRHHKDESVLCKRCVQDGIAVGVVFTLGAEILLIAAACAVVWVMA